MRSMIVRRHGYNHGFTLVELFVVIAVLSILVLITIFYIGDWRARSAQTEVQNALKNAAAAMEESRNFGTGYPATIPSSYTATPHVSVQLMSSTQTTYCINGWSTVKTTVRYYVNAQAAPVAGNCP